MQRYIITGALAALASANAVAPAPAADAAAAPAANNLWQDKAVPAPPADPLSFVDQHWGEVTVGDKWPIKWSKGNGEKVALSVQNTTWEHVICGKIQIITPSESLLIDLQTMSLLQASSTGPSRSPSAIATTP
jgi:hypothetical protein